MFEYVNDIVEALRGKTQILSVDIAAKDKTLTLDMDDSLIGFIEWKYSKLIVKSIKSLGKGFDKAVVVAKQVFSDKRFTLVFRRDLLEIVGKDNMDETLFLDISRYTKSKGVGLEISK